MGWRRSLTLGAVAIGAVVVGPAVETLEAQTSGYFGRNKVQYASFDFRVLKTEHFDIHYYEEEEDAARMAARMAERWYARLSRVFSHEFRARQPVILYANHAHFEQTNATPNQIDEATGGFTEILKRRVVLPMAGALAETDHVLGHELVHAFQFDMTGQGPSAVGVDVPGAIRLPLWFIEGMAEYLSLGPVDPFTAQWMRDAIRQDEFPSIPELRDPKYFPYRFGHAFWSFIAGTYGEDKIGRILRLAGRSGNALGAIQVVLETSIDDLSERWRQEAEDYWGPLAEVTEDADAFGRRVIFEERTGGRVNLGPALSPDGTELVFLSERGLFSIEMYLADARTGEVKRRLTKTALDPHFESLQFLNSSGSWHPDGRRFAVAAVTRGKPVISVLDTRNASTVREYRLPNIGAAFTPAWSPDGSRLAFTASVNGFLDLYVLDAETGELTRLTVDPFADMQPTWSPDGRRLAFVTDRFGADLETLSGFKPYRLATVEVASGRIEPLPGPEGGKNIDPHWAPEGDIYFVSDHLGISNVFRLEPETGRTFQVTNLWTGASGITPLSPALSVARETGDLAVNVNRGGPFSFEVYVIDDRDVLAGSPAPEFLAAQDPSVLPPRERLLMDLPELLANARLGLADPITFDDEPYSAALSLDFVAQPTLAVAASDFGVFFAGGATLFFSDMLGDRNLTTLLQVQSGRGDVIKGTAALAAYENRSSRWNWGVVGGQIPLVTAFFDRQFATVGPDTAAIFRIFRFFQIDRQATGVIAYPFNRAQRVEFSLSARSIDFAAEVEEVGVEVRTGRLLFDTKRDLPNCSDLEDPGQASFFTCSPSSLNMVSGSTALVYDTSIFGGTSPVAGQRYRLEVRPTLGSLNFVTALADYRRYIMLARPLSIAGRALHFGRYGGGGDDARLRPLFVGFPSLVRGYDDDSFDARECRFDDNLGRCPVFEQLLGSRIGVANLELRLPLLGGIGVVPAPGVPPIEIGTFFDAGIAWRGVEGERLGDRQVVKSYGFLGRINLFGFAVAEVDFVNPIDRPDQDWFWQFNLQPGF